MPMRAPSSVPIWRWTPPTSADFAKALAYAHQATVERRAQLKAANGLGDTGTGFTDCPRSAAAELAHSLRIEAEMALRLGDLPNARLPRKKPCGS